MSIKGLTMTEVQVCVDVCVDVYLRPEDKVKANQVSQKMWTMALISDCGERGTENVR